MLGVDISSPQTEPGRSAEHATTALAHPIPAPSRPARRFAAWSWWLLRVTVTVQVLLIFAQPLLAGRFLAGDFSMLELHRANGTVAGVVTMAQIATTLLAWLVGGAPGRLFGAAVAFGAATALQLYAGFNHLLGLHIPLGVALVGCNGWLLVWVWSRGPGAPFAARPAAGDR
jgi:hypothetical protein